MRGLVVLVVLLLPAGALADPACFSRRTLSRTVALLDETGVEVGHADAGTTVELVHEPAVGHARIRLGHRDLWVEPEVLAVFTPDELPTTSSPSVSLLAGTPLRIIAARDGRVRVSPSNPRKDFAAWLRTGWIDCDRLFPTPVVASEPLVNGCGFGVQEARERGTPRRLRSHAAVHLFYGLDFRPPMGVVGVLGRDGERVVVEVVHRESGFRARGWVHADDLRPPEGAYGIGYGYGCVCLFDSPNLSGSAAPPRPTRSPRRRSSGPRRR